MADVSDLVDPTGKPLQSTKEEVVQKEVEVNIDFKDKYLRALADYKNLQRKVDEERKLIFTIATANVLEQIIPTVDLLYKAEVFMKDPGMQLVKEQLVHVLEEFGLKEIALVGKQYDPTLAEAVDTVTGEKDNLVVEEVRKGYMLGDRVIRVGQVKVSKKKQDNNENVK